MVGALLLLQSLLKSLLAITSIAVTPLSVESSCWWLIGYGVLLIFRVVYLTHFQSQKDLGYKPFHSDEVAATSSFYLRFSRLRVADFFEELMLLIMKKVGWLNSARKIIDVELNQTTVCWRKNITKRTLSLWARIRY